MTAAAPATVHAQSRRDRSSDPVSHTGIVRLIGVCAALLFGPLLLPLLTGRVLTLDDLGRYHLPLRYLYSQALQRGDSVLWSPTLFSGYYMFGEGQAGMAHPYHWLLYRWLPLDFAFQVEILTNYIFLFAGVRIFFARMRIAREPAWFGALAFTFGGSTLLHLVHVNAIAVIAHLPWLMVAIHTMMLSDDARRRARAFIGMALLLASALLMGHPQFAWLSGLSAAFLVVCLLLAKARPRRLVPVAGAVILGVLMSAVQLLTTLDVLRESSHLALTPDLRFEHSLVPFRDLQLFLAPHVVALRNLHEYAAYTGAFCTTAIGWLAIRWRELPHRRFVAACLAFSVLNIVLALGPRGWLYPALASLPGVSSFRAPVRHLVLAHLGMAGVSAVVFADLLDVVRRQTRIAWIRLLPLAIAPCASVLVSVTNRTAGSSGGWSLASDPSLLLRNLAHPLTWTLILVLMTVLVTLAARAHRWSLVLIIVLATLDQGAWGYSYVYGLNGEWYETVDALVARTSAPSAAKPGDLIFEPFGSDGEAGNVNVMRALRRSSGYVGLAPRQALDPADVFAQRVGGVAWRQLGGRWQEVTDRMPRVRLLSDAQPYGSVRQNPNPIDISKTALVDQDVPELTGAPGMAAVTMDRPGFIRVRVFSPGRQLLVLTERFHSGWQARTSDGLPVPVVRVYGDFLGCIVEPTTHQVTLRFLPPSFRIGLFLSILGVGLTFAAAFTLGRKNWRS